MVRNPGFITSNEWLNLFCLVVVICSLSKIEYGISFAITAMKNLLLKVPVWTQLPELLVEFHTKDFLCEIGGKLGSFVSADLKAAGRNQMRFRRILTTVDLPKPLKSKGLDWKPRTRNDHLIIRSFLVCYMCDDLP